MTDKPIPGEVGVRTGFAPPAHMIPEIEGKIAKAIESLGDADVGLFAVADRKGGWNLATAAKIVDGDRHKIAVVSWIGKPYGEDESLDWGVQAMWTMKFNKEKSDDR